MNKSKYLGVTCVRHVIQHCGGYLLDSLGPPVPRVLGKTSLMVIREAVINGAVNITNFVSSLILFYAKAIIKYLMTGPKGNSEFCFPETLNVPRGEAEGNIEVEGKQNSLFPEGPVIKCFVIPPISK